MSSPAIALGAPRPVGTDAGRRFDWLVITAITWLLGGLYADGWAHRNGRTDIGALGSVVVWCRQVSVTIGDATFM